MNANLKQPTPAINQWLTDATAKLTSVGIDSAHLDAELILAYPLGKNRTFLHSHSEQIICSKDLKISNSYLLKRLKRMPIAYILGFKEFYGRNYKVSPAVLIPRPESEQIIEILREILPPSDNHLPTTTSSVADPEALPPTTYHLLPTNLVDVGTGSGCLGITAKLEFPYLDVTLTDISQKALNIATLNAKGLVADLECLKSDLLASIRSNPNIIVANLPYVDKNWDCSPETAFEPSLALFADDGGKLLIKRLIIESSQKLSPNGYLILECDPRQHKSLTAFAKKHSFKIISKTKFVLAFQSTKN